MTWIVLSALVFVVVVIALVVGWHQRSSRNCPSCGIELVTVSGPGEGPNGGYEIVACIHCSQTATFVDQIRSGHATCPACHAQTLEVPTVRLAGLPPRVGVRETCASCGHEKSFTVTARDDGPGGKVIAFPGVGDRERRRHTRHTGEGA